MQPLNKLSPAQLQRKTDELDARENYIETREKLASSLEADIAESQRQIGLLDTQIGGLETVVQGLRTSITDCERYLKSLQSTYKTKVIEYKIKLKNWQDKLTQNETTIKLAHINLKNVNATIDERKKYQLDQEAHITDLMDAGNLQFKGLDIEITEAQHVLKELKIAIRTLKQDKSTTESDIEVIRQDYQQEEQISKNKIIALENQVAEALERNNQAEAKFLTVKNSMQQIHDETNAKLKILEVKEREIMTKREALRLEEEEMIEKRRQWASAESLYKI